MNKAKLIAELKEKFLKDKRTLERTRATDAVNEILTHIEAFGGEEKFYCAEWYRTGSLCEGQCSGCKRADELVVTNPTPTVPTFTVEEINEALEKARLQWWATPNRGLREVQTSAILNLINTKLGGQGK